MTNDTSAIGHLALLGVLVAGLSAGPAYAQETPEQRDACMHDTDRFCENAMPDVGRAIECLKAHRNRLNHRCRAALDAPAPAPAAPSPQSAQEKPAAPAAPPPTPQATGDKPAQPAPVVTDKSPGSRPHPAFAPHWRYTLRKPQVPLVHRRAMTAAERVLAMQRSMARRCNAAGQAYNANSGTCGYNYFGGFLQ